MTMMTRMKTSRWTGMSSWGQTPLAKVLCAVPNRHLIDKKNFSCHCMELFGSMSCFRQAMHACRELRDNAMFMCR